MNGSADIMLWILLIPVVIYSAVIIVIARSVARPVPFKGSSLPTLRISVIVPCRNAEGELPYLLADLKSQSYPQELFEVLIVDDHSSDGTSNVVDKGDYPSRFRLVHSAGHGKKSAIRRGLVQSGGDLIVTTDADCRVTQEWLASIAEFCIENRPALIIGPVELSGGRGLFHRFQELEFLSLQGVTSGCAEMGTPVMCNGANLAFPPDIYLENAADLHFETPSGDDIFLLHGIMRRKSGRVAFHESARSLATARSSATVGEFLKQRARWISKAGLYRNGFTIFLGVVTFLAAMSFMAMLAAAFIEPEYLFAALAILLLRSIPDYILLKRITTVRNRHSLMKWFIPSQVIYPFYVLAVSLLALFRKSSW